MKRQCIWRCNF
ncbi:hypothetical protein V9N51_003543 [Vibrio cholerae]